MTIVKRLCPILLILAVAAMSGCTHNNGDIGPWFGTWKLNEISVDGVVDTDYADNVLWKFQTEIICMLRVEPRHTRTEAFGTWEQNGNSLILSFTYNDDKGTTQYEPLPETGIPYGITELAIDRLTGSELQLTYHATDGSVYKYKFTKW